MILEGKSVLVTGGTGSMGKNFVRRVLAGELGTPRKVIVLSRDEAKQHDMRMEYLHRVVATDEVIYRNFMNVLEFRIGDVRDFADVCRAVRDADVVINAAALKQVPACEYFPGQAILTNCVGAMNIVRAIEENRYPVETVVAISTDKACKPVNVMGMTKSLQERIFTAANVLNPQTRFVSVRYGNVLASRGSVIPLFLQQLRDGLPLTVTDPTMTRFLMSLEESVALVLYAFEHARPGDIFVQKSPASTVGDLASALRALLGKDNAIRVIGTRHGEKLYESLVSREEMARAEDLGAYFRIPADSRDLNYAKYFVEGEERISAFDDYTSHNTTRLDVEGVKAVLRRLPEVQEAMRA